MAANTSQIILSITINRKTIKGKYIDMSWYHSSEGELSPTSQADMINVRMTGESYELQQISKRNERSHNSKNARR